MQHNQRNILIAVLLTMLVLKGCSAPNKQKTPQERRQEAYEALDRKNGILPTPQEMKKAMHKYVDNSSDDLAQERRQEAYEALDRKNGIPPTPQEMKKATYKYVDNISDDLAQKLREDEPDPYSQVLSLQQYKEILKGNSDNMIDQFSRLSQEKLKRKKISLEKLISDEEEKLKYRRESKKEKVIRREAIQAHKFLLKCIENFIK